MWIEYMAGVLRNVKTFPTEEFFLFLKDSIEILPQFLL